MEIFIAEKSVFDDDSQELLLELNSKLTIITGDDGTGNFSPMDVENDESVFLVAYVDKTPAGCGAFRKITNDIAEIKRIYARTNDVGIGKRIVETLEEKAKKIGYSKIVLETRIQNEHAIKFYKRLGYVHCEAFGKYIGKTNAYCFEKKL